MKILNITIHEFAGLGQRSYDLSEGLNIIEGPNESGKSSILAFIKFVLYGFNRHSSGDELGERERYVSWTGKRAAGSLTAIAGGRKWRIERELFIQTRGGRESPNETCRIVDAETGTEEYAGEIPGKLFLGIPAEVFSSTCGIAQSSLASINSAEVGSSIENLLFSADESLNAEKASEKLDAARRQLLHKNEKSGRLVDMRSERNALRNRLSAASTAARNMIAKEALAADYKRRADEARELLEKLEAMWDISEVKLTLGKFDELRELEKKHSELSGSLAKLEKDTFPDGFIADRQYAARLGALSRELTSAESELSRAEAELIKLENSVPYDLEKVKTAEFLFSNASGDTESVLCVYRLLKKSVMTLKRMGVLMLILGGAAAAAGVYLTVLSYTFPGLAVAASGAAAIAGGIMALIKFGKKRGRLSDYLAKLNFTADPGESGLARYIDGCFKESQNQKKYLELLEARRGVVNIHKDKLAEVRTHCRDELKKIGRDEGNENLPPALSESAEAVISFCAEWDSIALRLEHTDNEISALRGYLQKFDETLLRRQAEALPDAEPLTSEEYRRRRLELMNSIKTAEDKQHATENELAALGATAENPRRLAVALEQHENQLAEMQLKYDAIKLAGEALAEAAVQLRRGVTPMLRNSACELMEKLTGGRYTELGVGQDMSVTVNAGGATRPISAMSGGTRDAAYISLRIALASLLCRKEVPFLLIDEGLSQLDDLRAANLISILLEWCGKENGQCLIFTCHSREAALASGKAAHIKL